MPSGSVTVTVGALSTLLRAHGIGELPVAVRPSPVWTDQDGERAAIAAAVTEFREVGWIDRWGRLDGEALDSLHVLARPAVEYTAFVARRGRQHRVVVAGRGSTAVLVIREGNAVTLTVLRHRSLPEALLRHLPDTPPAPVDAVNVRLDAADHRLAGLARNDPIGQGELSVTVHDHYGRRRTSTPIRYQDYRFGRVVVVAADGYLSVAPAGKPLLLARLRDAYRDLTR